MQISPIGLDIAKNVFQVHGIDSSDKVVVRKQLRRGQVVAFFKALPPCLVGIEACATAHYWARELTNICRLCCRCHRHRCDGYCVAGRGTGRLGIVLSWTTNWFG